jgi:hypothetical protein
MTKSKRWPNRAEWARLDSICLARKGRGALLAELERVTDPGVLRSMTKAMEAFREIESQLTACRSEEPEK